MSQEPTTYPPQIAPWRRNLSHVVERAAGRTADWLLLHWLDILNVALGLVIFVALLTPVLAYLGIEPLAGQIFRAYHSICEQIPSHAFFILGHQVALCARNFSLYASLWAGTMIFRFLRGRIRPLPFPLVLLFLLPMALDGGTQMMGWHESNVVLRIITGTLFGLGICWFALPYIQEAADESGLTPALTPAR
jgi:uncharacterized membrane protein